MSDLKLLLEKTAENKVFSTLSQISDIEPSSSVVAEKPLQKNPNFKLLEIVSLKKMDERSMIWE